MMALFAVVLVSVPVLWLAQWLFQRRHGRVKFYVSWSLWTLYVAGLVLTYAGILDHESHGSNAVKYLQHHAGQTAGQVFGVLLVSGVVMFIWIKVARYVDDLQSEIMRPVPTPAEIHYAYFQEHGKAPSYEEINAIQQVCARHRNEAAFKGAILAGGAILGVRAVNGKGLL